jgi:hypothetical protein
LTYVKHELDVFPWHLTGRLTHLLNKPEASFDYLHFTTYSLARAAMLILKGNVMNHKELHSALIMHRIQIGEIYRKHLLDCIHKTLSIQNLGQLPECDFRPLNPLHDPKQVEKNRELILRVIQAGEIYFLNTLNFISENPSMDEEIAGESVGFLVKKVKSQKAVSVPVRVTRHAGGYEVRPCSDEAKQHFKAGREAVKFAVGLQEEFPLGKEVSSQNSEDRKRDGGMPKARVVGDFNAVILPSGRKMVLTRKHKRRAFLRAVYQWCTKEKNDVFFWQDILEDYNKTFKDPGQRAMIISSDRIDNDLFKGQKAEFDELFQILDRTAGHLRLKLHFLISKMGCWGLLCAFGSSLSEYAADVPW